MLLSHLGIAVGAAALGYAIQQQKINQHEQEAARIAAMRERAETTQTLQTNTT